MRGTSLLIFLVSQMSANFALTFELTPVASSVFEFADDQAELQAFEEPISLGLLDKVRYELYVEIGFPSQGFSLMIDTTFPFVAVVDANCHFCYASDTFSAELSNSYRLEGKEAVVGGISGILGQDIVMMRNDDRLVALNQTLLIVQHDSKEMFSKGVGALGLGLERPFKGHLSFVESLKAQGVIKMAVFALYLGKYVAPPSISFGEWDLARFSENDTFTFISANTSQGLWDLVLSSAHWGNDSLLSTPGRAIVDSSERKLTVPKQTFDFVRDHICSSIHCFGDEHTFGYVCSDMPRRLLPNITLTLDDTDIVISPNNYVKVTIPRKGSKKCHVQIDWKKGESRWLLGFPFLRSYYVLFDIENSRIGLSPALEVEEIPIGLRFMILLVGVVLLVALIFVVFVCLGSARFAALWRKKPRMQVNERLLSNSENRVTA